MKQTFTLLFLTLSLFASAQYFGKQYPFWEEAAGDAVIAYDDGYAILGFASKGYQDNYLFIIRTDLNGDTLWTKQVDVGNNGTSLGYINAYTRDSDGNIYLAFSRADSANLIKFSTDFEVLWMRKFDPEIEIKQVIISKDNNLLFNGENALNEHRLYKADKEGNILWQSVALPHHHPQLWLSSSPSIIEMDDNSIVLVSILSDFIGTLFSDMYSFSQNGDTISLTNFGWIFTDVHADGNELIGIAHDGNLTFLGGNLLVRFQPDGTILWSHPLNFDPQNVLLYKFVRNSDGELIAAGGAGDDYEYTHVILHSMSATGDSLWSSLSMPSEDTWPLAIALTNDGEYVVTGYSRDYPAKSVPFLLKTDARGTLSINEPMVRRAISVFPNPAREEVAFEILNINSGIITITDIFGRTIDEIVITSEKTIWDSRAVVPGTYFYQFDDRKQLSSGMFLIVK